MTRRFVAGVTVAAAGIAAYVALCEARGARNPQLPAPVPAASAAPATTPADVFLDPSVHQQMAALENRARYAMLLYRSPGPSAIASARKRPIPFATAVHGVASPSR